MTDYFLFDDQLSQMRADVARMLPQTGTVFYPTYAPDGAGGGSLTYTASGTVACRLDPALSSGKQDFTAGREALLYDYVATLPYDCTIANDYRLTCNGVTYEVKNLSVNHAWNVSKRATVTRIG